MAWTNVGFDGTINEAQWSQMSTLMGSSGGGYLAAGNGDCLVTAVGGARSVSVAAGSLYGDGIVSTNSAPEVVAMTTPVNGQWYVIALRRTWATNTAALVAIAGATTTTTTPTAPPTSFPTLNTNQGVLTDQPIAWAWCNSANTTVVVYDIRLKGTKSTPPVVANQGERDAKFMSPTQGLQVWRDDLGVVETYLGLYNASTNPGGADVAGWTSTPRQYGLVPVRPTTATIATGTGSANSLGVVSFTGATAITLDGIFTADYQNYKILINYKNTANTQPNLTARIIVGGSVLSATNYLTSWMGVLTGTFTSASSLTDSSIPLQLPIAPSSDISTNAVEMTVFSPYVSTRTTQVLAQSQRSRNIQISGGEYNVLNQTTGIYIFPSADSITGTIQVFGYND